MGVGFLSLVLSFAESNIDCHVTVLVDALGCLLQSTLLLTWPHSHLLSFLSIPMIPTAVTKPTRLHVKPILTER